ncbi:Hypothetical predicted protein [Pelobates cultripes]|uniref:Uncharacterized protein n=1 Tax=Pelobates cultripes TaxID=61616 RepID=A0AAD1SC05_PELCU|nr:Hypothetical predicted protein [Pelobates cultripes]
MHPPASQLLSHLPKKQPQQGRKKTKVPTARQASKWRRTKRRTLHQHKKPNIYEKHRQGHKARLESMAIQGVQRIATPHSTPATDTAWKPDSSNNVWTRRPTRPCHAPKLRGTPDRHRLSGEPEHIPQTWTHYRDSQAEDTG